VGYNFGVKRFNLKQKIDGFLNSFAMDIGVDLGTSNTLFYVKDKGVVVEEPTLLARQKVKRWTGLSAPKKKKGLVVAYGSRAKEMLDREPKQIEVVCPLKRGVVSDLGALESFLGYYLRLIYEVPTRWPKIFKPRVIVGVPGIITGVERRAIKSVFGSFGVRKIYLVEQSVLAAIGIGLSVESSSGLMVVDVGGGKTEVSVVSSGGVVAGEGIKTGGEDWDKAIIDFLKMKYGVLVGKRTAESIKIKIGILIPSKLKKREIMVVRGRDLESGLPKSLKLDSVEIMEPLLMVGKKIINLVSSVLDEIPPEIADDVLGRGVCLLGGGGRLRGLDGLMEEELKFSVRLIEDPELAVIKGCGELMERPDLLEKVRLVAGLN